MEESPRGQDGRGPGYDRMEEVQKESRTEEGLLMTGWKRANESRTEESLVMTEWKRTEESRTG
jgi:hypothetical protein